MRTISRIIKGRYVPSLDLMIALSGQIESKLSDLFIGNQDFVSVVIAHSDTEAVRAAYPSAESYFRVSICFLSKL